MLPLSTESIESPFLDYLESREKFLLASEPQSAELYSVSGLSLDSI